MASYRKEIRKWMGILLDKYFLDAAYEPKTLPLTLEQAYLLANFPRGASVTEYTQFYRVKRAKALSELSELIRRGYVHKREDEKDQRKRRLELTDEGERVRGLLLEEFDEKVDFLLSGLSHNEEVGILKFISKINQLTVEKYKIEEGE